MNLVNVVDSKSLRNDLPRLAPGDHVKVHIKVPDSARKKNQIFEGVVTRVRGSGMGASFTVRKISFGEGVERTLPSHSPLIDHIEVLSTGKVRRARLYYLRGLKGKAAKIKPRDLR